MTSRSSLTRKVPALSWDDCRLLVQSVTDYAIFMLDTSGHVATWNAGAETIKGYRADEIIGSHFSRFYLQEDIEAGKPERELEIAAEVGRVEDEAWRVRKDGSRFWANVVITAIRDETGTLRGFGKVTRDLTTRKEAEERLRASEERFHGIVDAVTDYAIFGLDATGHIATWNVGAQRTKGWLSEEIIGRHFSVFYTPEDRAVGKPEKILETVRREGRFEEEMWRVRKDGSRFWANVVINAVRNDRGETTGFAKVTRDLTARRRAEETARQLAAEQATREASEAGARALRESEERYRALSRRLEAILEGVGDGITVQDRAGQIIFANTAAARICGFQTVAELTGTPPAAVTARFEILGEDGRPIAIDELPGRRVLRGEPGGSMLMRVHDRTTGRRWWSLVRASPVPTPAGEPDLAINIWHDVTIDRRRERDAKHLADATVALAQTLDRDVLLAGLRQALAPALADQCEIALTSAATIDRAELRDGGATLVAPIRVRDAASGTLTLRSSSRRLDEHDVTLVQEICRRTGIAIENASLYEASQEAKRTAEAAAQTAEQANRIKDEFLATVSHELRTPLNAIVGWAAILRQQALDPTVGRAIEVIDRNAQAQVKLIEDILDVSRIITGKLRLELHRTDLVAVTREAIEVIRPSAAAKQIAIAFEVETPTCVLVGDPDRLRQVVWNLLSNAVKFTDAHGRIAIAIRQDAAEAVVVVSDTGRGIPPDFLPYVFDRFKQADATTTRRFGGLGLGLSLVRHLAELHGGSVHAESAGDGMGSTFTIKLPIRAVLSIPPRERPPGAHRLDAPLPQELLQGLRVLVIDDDPDARDLLITVLEGAGAAARAATSAAEGFDAVKLFRPHVVVSDVGMPDEDGYSFARRLRALDAQEGGVTPSIALTAYTRREDRTKALAAGFTTHLGKPVNPDDLVAVVANLAPFSRR